MTTAQNLEGTRRFRAASGCWLSHVCKTYLCMYHLAGSKQVFCVCVKLGQELGFYFLLVDSILLSIVRDPRIRAVSHICRTCTEEHTDFPSLCILASLQWLMTPWLKVFFLCFFISILFNCLIPPHLFYLFHTVGRSQWLWWEPQHNPHIPGVQCFWAQPEQLASHHFYKPTGCTPHLYRDALHCAGL